MTSATFSLTIAAVTGTAFPGQPGNPVGFAAAPGYPGSLTASSVANLVSGTPGNPKVYSFLDFDAGTGGTDLWNVHDVTFIGCRFQSNRVDYFNVHVASANMTFKYCSFTPRKALYTSPPGAAWPSAAVGQNTTVQTTDVNCINGNSGYQYGVFIDSGGPVTMQHCDVWGYGNAIDFMATTASMVLDNCWIHDAANASPQGYHTDGPGYLNGTTPPQNITISNCTIASLGNTNGIAWQAATSAYKNIVMTGNYLSGFGYTAALFLPGNGGAQNCLFQDNILATDIQAVWGPIYGSPAAMFTGSTNKWRGNKLKVYPGTQPRSGAWQFTAADDGKFLWPDSTLHTTDFTG